MLVLITGSTIDTEDIYIIKPVVWNLFTSSWEFRIVFHNKIEMIISKIVKEKSVKDYLSENGYSDSEIPKFITNIFLDITCKHFTDEEVQLAMSSVKIDVEAARSRLVEFWNKYKSPIPNIEL